MKPRETEDGDVQRSGSSQNPLRCSSTGCSEAQPGNKMKTAKGVKPEAQPVATQKGGGRKRINPAQAGPAQEALKRR